MAWFHRGAGIYSVGLLSLALLGAGAAASTPDPHRFDPPQIIDDNADGATQVIAADIDGDGRIDLASASYNNDTIAWYKNNGNNVFLTGFVSTSADGAFAVAAADLDNDGDIDIASASERDDTIAWYENDGKHSFTKFTVATNADGARSVIAVDLDRDGDMDLVSASYNDNTIAWFENKGGKTFERFEIATNIAGAHSVTAADLDGDGDIDLASASYNDDTIAWFENDNKQNFRKHKVFSEADGARSVIAVDFDGDGDIDLASASERDKTIAWYENVGERTLTRNVVTEIADGAWSVVAGDFDRDGDTDLASTSRNDDTVAWYINKGQDGFTRAATTDRADSARGLAAADFDGDGDTDLAYAAFRGDSVGLIENITITKHNNDGEGLNRPHGFVDVPNEGWKTDAVVWMKASKVTTGCGTTTFCPDEALTREQQITFLYRYAGKPTPTATNPFSDVDRNRYFATPIDWAYEQGIASGYNGTSQFGTGDPVTRGQAITMLWRQAGEPTPVGTPPFTDVEASDYSADAITWAYENGLTIGTSPTTFSPDHSVTRTQFAAFLSRYDNLAE